VDLELLHSKRVLGAAIIAFCLHTKEVVVGRTTKELDALSLPESYSGGMLLLTVDEPIQSAVKTEGFEKAREGTECGLSVMLLNAALKQCMVECSNSLPEDESRKC